MRIFDPTHANVDVKGFRHFGKQYGRSLHTKEDVLDAFRLYFSAGLHQTEAYEATNGSDPQQERVRRRAITNILLQLRPIRRWFEDNKSLRFYASSLLFVYEGDLSKDSDAASVKMIDFGRVRRESGVDNGYKTGLHALKHVLDEVLEHEEEN